MNDFKIKNNKNVIQIVIEYMMKSGEDKEEMREKIMNE